MKLRNQLLALFCLLLFAAFGFIYIRLWVVQKPFGVILFVSDGMVARHLTAARLFENGADHHLALESFPHVALVSNHAHDYAVPDSASAATALATGTKVNHRNVGCDLRGKPLKSILELAKAKGRSVGLITTGAITDPSAAAFYAHVPDARDTDQISLQFVEKARLDLALAGGAQDLRPKEEGGLRTDSRNLLNELQKQGGKVIRTKAELEMVPAFGTGRVVGIFSNGPMAFSNQPEAVPQPSLSDMVRRAIELLQTSGNGYVLVVDASSFTRAAAANQGERTILETIALDKAIATASKYAGEKSLILAVGKHSTGGFSLNGYPPRQDNGMALLGTSAAGHPSITWATGPNGPGSTPEPSAFKTPSALNTAEDVIAIGRGDGSERLRGFIDNTQIFEILRGAL